MKRTSLIPEEYEVLNNILEELDQSPGLFFNRICEIIREKSRADLVWLGFLDKDGSVKPKAYSGKFFAYLKDLRINVFHPQLSRGPTGQAILEKEPRVESDISTSSTYAPWRERALYFGFKSSLALPLIYQKKVFGTLNLYSLEKNFFDPQKIFELKHCAQQVALAIKIYERFEKLGRDNHVLKHRLEQLDRELKEKELHLKHLEESRDRWLALLGHELRTPLTSILGFSEMLLSGLFGKPTEKQIRYLKHIKKNAEFILHILEELQKLARFKYNRSLSSEVFSLKEVVQSTIFLLTEKINEKEAQIKTDYEEKFKIKGQSHIVQEVIFNLLSNALKFSPQGGKIFLRARKETDLRKRSWVALEIVDEGPGIKPADYYRIFKPFVQAGEFYTEKPMGLGLGLSLSRELVENQGGVLLALPSAEGGHFTIFLPETPLKERKDIEILLLEPRAEVVYRLALIFAGEGFRSTAFPDKEPLLTTLKEEKGTFVLALDPWEHPREARELFLSLEREDLFFPTFLYRAEGQSLKLALTAHFFCLRPLNFPYLRKLRRNYLGLFETLPSRVFLGARPHLAWEAQRLLSALDLELVSHPGEAEVVALDLGLTAEELLQIVKQTGSNKPIFMNFSDSGLRKPEIIDDLPPEEVLKEIGRLLLGLKSKVSRAGALA